MAHTHLSLAVRSSSVVLAIVVAAAAQLYWKATGRAAGYLVGTAGWLMALSALAQLAGRDDIVGWALLQSVPLILAAVWVGRAILGPTIDAANGPRRQSVLASILLVSIWGTATGFAAALDVPTGAFVALLDVGAAAAWSAVAIVGLLRALRGTSILLAWSAWMAVCLALASIAHPLSILQGGDRALIAGTLQLVALLVAAVGAAAGLSRSAIVRREALYAASLRHEEERTKQNTDARERSREIRTALLAIEGATLTLERHRDRFDAEQREYLAAAVHDGMVHRRRLTQSRRPAATQPALALLRHRVALARSRGLTVALHTTVERHTCRTEEGRVAIEVSAEEQHLIVTVQDDGPAIPAEAYERIPRDASSGQGSDEGQDRRKVVQAHGSHT